MKKTALFYGVLALALIAIFLPGFSRMQQLKEECSSLEKQILDLKVTNEELKTRIYKLENDPVYVESIIREKLKKSKKGEIVYKTR